MPWVLEAYLVLQACISFCSVSDRSGASMFLNCLHKNVVAHVNIGICTCNCTAEVVQ